MTARDRSTFPPADGSWFGPLILIADDSATVRIVIKHALEREGLQTLQAATPLEVLGAAGDAHPDLVLLDITFANGALTDGYQLCRMLRDLQDFRETPILLVSGRDGIIDKLRGRLAGATDYITKPFDMPRLVAQVRELAFTKWMRRQEVRRRS
jgi:twitching motility two-component system response regulator PilG